MQRVIKSLIYTIVLLVLLNSLFFIVIAVYKCVQAYLLLAKGRMEEKPGVLIAESLDSFMIALFFIIFSIGIAKLFLPASKLLRQLDLPWLRIETFSQLKYIMWEVMLTTLFVYFVSEVVIAGSHHDWQTLIMPTSILMLTLAYKFMKHGH